MKEVLAYIVKNKVISTPEELLVLIERIIPSNEVGAENVNTKIFTSLETEYYPIGLYDSRSYLTNDLTIEEVAAMKKGYLEWYNEYSPYLYRKKNEKYLFHLDRAAFEERIPTSKYRSIVDQTGKLVNPWPPGEGPSE